MNFKEFKKIFVFQNISSRKIRVPHFFWTHDDSGQLREFESREDGIYENGKIFEHKGDIELFRCIEKETNIK